MIRGSKSPFVNYCKWIPVTALSCFLGGTIATSVHAEQDFEYAKLLVERDEQSFPTDDIIGRLITKLLETPSTQLEGKLIKATFLRHQAATSSSEKKNKLLTEANDLYKEVLAGDKKFRLMSVAERDAASMTSEMIRAQIDLAGNDKVKARELRAQAASNQEIIANAQKTNIDAAEPKFVAEFTKYTEYVKTHTDQESGEVKPPYPNGQMDALMKTFDEWIIADKRYVAAKVEQINCYDDSDPAKKAAAEVMAKYCDEKINNEKLADFPVITSWYSFMQGRIYGLVGDDEKASASWGTALGLEMQHLNDDQRKQMFQLKKFIIHDLIKMNMKGKKYAAVEEYIATSLIDPVLRTLFDDDSGKDLLIDYSKALTFKDGADQSDVEKAIKKLREQIEKEKGVNSVWAARFSRAMAEVLDYARSHKGMMPRLSGQEWYDAARGFFVMGQTEHQKYVEMERDAKGDPKNKEQFEKAYTEFQNAVDFYRRAVTAARSADLLTRVTVEPKAWFEMGLCYLKMRHYYEAIVVYQAMRNTFLPEFRGKLLPEPTSADYKKFVTKAVKDAIEELDKPKDGLIAKSGSNVLYAFEENKKLHNGAGDMWNKALQGKVLSTDTSLIKDSGISDIAYTQARTTMDEAKSFSDNGKFNAKDAKLSEDAYGQALTKYTAAAEKFLKVAPTSDAYEIALFQAGCCYNYAQGIWSDKLPSRRADAEAAIKDLGAKGVAAFDKYMEYVAKNAAKKDEDKDRRKKLEGEVLLVRNALSFGMQDWPMTLKTADEYLNWEKDNPTNSKKDAAMLNKFVALISLAAQNFAPKSDQFLKDAEAVMRDVRVMKPKDNKLFRTMLDQLGRRYNIAAFQVDKFLKENHTDVTTDMQDLYEDKVAEIQLERVTVVEEEANPNEEVSLEDYSRLVYLFDKASHRVKDREKATSMQEKSAEMAKKLLDKYDPTKKNLRIPEDKDAWQPLLNRMIGDNQTVRGLLRIQEDFKGDVNRRDQCKRDHSTLIDYMYDTVPQDTPADKRPDYDKQKTDLEKARQQLKTIRDNYPNIPTLADKAGNVSAAAAAVVTDWIDAVKEKYPDLEQLKPKKGEPAKAPLQIIEEEIDFRRKIEATRDLLSRQSLELAEKYAKGGNNDSAKKFREIASEQIKILGDLRGDTPVMMEQTAELDMADGKYKEAEETLWKIADNADKDSDTYFRAKRKLSEIFANQKKWREAAEFPEYIALVVGVKGNRPKRLWPDMASFLEECYKNGAPRPAALKLDGSDDVKDVKKDDVKKDDVKKDEPKADAPKADAPKTDEKKADEPKAEEKKADEKKPEEKKADEPKTDK